MRFLIFVSTLCVLPGTLLSIIFLSRRRRFSLLNCSSSLALLSQPMFICTSCTAFFHEYSTKTVSTLHSLVCVSGHVGRKSKVARAQTFDMQVRLLPRASQFFIHNLEQVGKSAELLFRFSLLSGSSHGPHCVRVLPLSLPNCRLLVLHWKTFRWRH